eukprot:2072338-Ditylum_brightwellii.AAC.1
MGIDSNDIPDRKARLALRAKFIAGIKFVFPVGVFVFKRYGSIANWVVVCRMIKGDSDRSKGFKGFITEATLQ